MTSESFRVSADDHDKGTSRRLLKSQTSPLNYTHIYPIAHIIAQNGYQSRSRSAYASSRSCDSNIRTSLRRLLPLSAKPHCVQAPDYRDVRDSPNVLNGQRVTDMHHRYLGDTSDSTEGVKNPLYIATRAQLNFAENVPLVLAVALLAEVNGADRYYCVR
jgi:hypothetical protein